MNKTQQQALLSRDYVSRRKTLVHSRVDPLERKVKPSVHLLVGDAEILLENLRTGGAQSTAIM